MGARTYTFLVLGFCLSTKGVEASTSCPSKCKCNATVVKCADRQLLTVPHFRRLTTTPLVIDLSTNEIGELEDSSFYSKRLEKLEDLYLNYNEIFNIEGETFKYLPNLQKLDLTSNLLEDLPVNMIRYNHKLIELSLSANHFSSNPPELHSASLQILDLSYCKISVFSESNLKSLPNLRVLYLHVNNLKHLDSNMFVGTKINYVDVYYNSWKCHCNTIKLFDFLTENKLIAIDKPLQCMHSSKWYEDIYNSNGPMHHNRLCDKTAQRTHHAVNNTKSMDIVHITQKAKDHEALKERGDAIAYLDYEITVIITTSVVIVAILAAAVFVIISRCNVSKRPLSHPNYIYAKA